MHLISFLLVNWLLQSKVCIESNTVLKLAALLKEYLYFMNQPIYFRLLHLSRLKNDLIIFLKPQITASLFNRRKTDFAATS